jgi:integrase-like protein
MSDTAQSLVLVPHAAVAVVDTTREAESARRYVAHSKRPVPLRPTNPIGEILNSTARPEAGSHCRLNRKRSGYTCPGLRIRDGSRPLSRGALAAISKLHSAAGFPDSPAAMRHACVKEAWAGIRRKKGTAQTAKTAATTDYLKRMLEQVPSTLAGVRDRALLPIGFAAALRRSELVALRVEDIRFVAEGIELTIRRSKTDQEGASEKIRVQRGLHLSTCPVRALENWKNASGIESGPLFRGVTRYDTLRSAALTDQVVALVKRYAKAASLSPDVFSGHSLPAGLATSAANAGASERRIMDHGPDPAQKRDHGSPLYPGRESVPR